MRKKVEEGLRSRAPGNIVRAAIVIALALLLAGCARLESASLDEANITGSTRPTAIALLDSGANPYLDVFRVPDDEWVRSAAPTPHESIELSNDGPIEERLDRDDAIWSSLRPGVLYHFSGTRLFGISFDHDRSRPYVRDGLAHGGPTSYLAAREAPDAIIVMVQTSTRTCFDGPEACPIEFDVDVKAMEWIADQAWIDIVSVSLALPANPALADRVHSGPERYAAATERAANSGKLVLNGAGNSVAPPAGHHYNGPPWVIAVGGMESARHGEHVLTGRGVDVVSNFSDFAPRRIRGEMEWVSGTSFATPIVAGTLARAMDIVRDAAPDRVTTTQQFRDALNASAVMWNATDWDPRPSERGGAFGGLIQYSNLPVLTQAQMGWGYVNGTFAEEIARRVLHEDDAIPPEKGQAAVFQPAWQRARETYWST